MTPAETRLWHELRGSRLDGIRFRRKHMVGNVILDFYAPAYHLGVEVAGGTHDAQQERENERTRLLGHRGIRVIRFRSDEVLDETEEVLERLRWELRFQVDGMPEI